MINWNIVRNPLNWLTVGLMAAFFVFALRECLRLFEDDGGPTAA